MDQDLIHMVVASKVPMLKPENGNAPPITKVVEGVEPTIAHATVEDKAQRRLQNLISHLEIHGESISQEDVNQKFLRSMSPEWNTHTIMWRNKPEIDTLCLDDIYNYLKIYEPESPKKLRYQAQGKHKKDRACGNTCFLSIGVMRWTYSKLIDCQIVDKCKTGLGYNVVPPPYTRNFLPPKPNFFGLEEFVNEHIVSEPTVKKHVVKTSEAKANAGKPKVVRKNFGTSLIEHWISDSEDEAESKC
uniref:Ribonuclease H-like domain-containing protein n=1 Tax=Tanacetum cinerariifolium TaxID=118510 RepID=A0A6L2JD60_TANCI|nr:ribonuclease H-like domain-containing protein [Tanacetum cinerariifolium]